MGRGRKYRDGDAGAAPPAVTPESAVAPAVDAGAPGEAGFDELAYATVPEDSEAEVEVEPDAGAVVAADAGADDSGPEAEAAGAPVPDDPGAAPRRRRLHPVAATFMIVGAALLAFATGITLFNAVVMPRLVHGVNDVKVPELVGLTLDQAEQTLRPMGLHLSRAGERFDASVPRGFVLEQDPGPGEFVRGGRRVSVVASLGEEFSSVPALFGESQRSAEVLLKSAGLHLGVITRAPNDDVGDGLVAGSDPGAETVLPRGSAVSLLISTGANQESFVMPDVLGREVGSVRRQLESFGLAVVTPHGSGTLGPIVAQDPAPGSRIPRNATVTLQASGRVIR